MNQIKNLKIESSERQEPLNSPDTSGQALKGTLKSSMVFNGFPFRGRGKGVENHRTPTFLSELAIVFLLVFVLLILVIVRNTDQHLFKKEVKTAIEVAATNSNMITMNQLQKLTELYLVIDLGSKVLSDSLHFQHSVQIPFEKLLDKPNRTILNEAKGTLILYSEDIATASRAFIILNQLGIKNLKILTSEENPEELKYKFQPDTKARLEEDGM